MDEVDGIDSDDSELREHDDRSGVLFDFEMHSLLKLERDFNVLMEENLKMNRDEVFEYLLTATATSTSTEPPNGHKESDSPWALLSHRHEVLLKLPLNEHGEMVSGRHSMHSLSTNTPRESPVKRQRARSPPQTPLTLDNGDRLSEPPSPRRDSMNESPTDSMTHDVAQSVDTLDLDPDDLMFEMDEEDDDDEDRSFMSTPPSSGYAPEAASKLKQIPELHINIISSADTVRSQESRSLSAVEIIHEDSETDDRVFAVEAPSRKRRNANTSKNSGGGHHGNQPLLSPQKSSQFGMKSSGSLRIKSKFESKSVLSRTLNVHSALVNLNKWRVDEEHSAKYHEATQSLSNSLEPSGAVAAKTFNPPKEWLEALKLDENKRKTKGRAQPNTVKPSGNGTLTVGTHTFSGIWAKTRGTNGDVDCDGGNDSNRGSQEEEDRETMFVHDLFETKQRVAPTSYAYSIAPKFNSLLSMEEHQQSQ